MIAILQRKNSIKRLSGLSFRSFIKVKKWSTSHYRDLMKIILQKHNVCTYLWYRACVIWLSIHYGKNWKFCWSGGLASKKCIPAHFKTNFKIVLKIRVKCKIFNLMGSWNGKRFLLYIVFLQTNTFVFW